MTNLIFGNSQYDYLGCQERDRRARARELRNTCVHGVCLLRQVCDACGDEMFAWVSALHAQDVAENPRSEP